MGKRMFFLWVFVSLFAVQVLAAADSWLIMLYQDADDFALEEDIFNDFNEAELVGSDTNVTIVSQLDRYSGSFEGDGDWSGTRRYLLKKDADPFVINSEKFELVEQDMAAPSTLVEFAVWAMKTYPADRYALIMSDHGAGWPGGWFDPDPDIAQSMLMESIASALKNIVAQTGVQKLDLIGFDACLMAQLEVFSLIAPYAKFAVASQETEPGMGWAYSGFLSRLQKNPKMDGAELSKAIIEAYIIEDSSVGTYYYGLSPQEVLSFYPDVTLSAVDLSRIADLQKSLNLFSNELVKEDKAVISKARSYARAYTNIFDNESSPDIDLAHFAAILKKETTNKNLQKACDALIAAISKTVISEMHGSASTGSSGISIHFPVSRTFFESTGSYDTYFKSLTAFVNNSSWDDFLKTYYTGEKYKPLTTDSATEVEQAPVVVNPEHAAPGFGKISITEIKTNKKKIKIGDVLEMDADITGNNIAYIYIFSGYYSEEDDAIYIMDKDYIEADSVKNIDGVYYPDWTSSAKHKIVFDWEPTEYFMANKNSEAFCYLDPQDYGDTADNALYLVSGHYKYADSGITCFAYMQFNGAGQLLNIYGFKNLDGTGAPFEIKARDKDTFTVLDNWIEFDTTGKQSVKQYEGETIVFGKDPVEWFQTDVEPGLYLVGFIVQDFDGNEYGKYVYVTVED